ncbi:MAG TPA: hypothetical protein VE971_01360 [Candidatus Eisenbacteria bacterium]|nr:hypothetical protein [Candidatus Eisenbacteria bacterium]
MMTTKVVENGSIHVQKDTGQRQACETAGSTPPILGSCTFAKIGRRQEYSSQEAYDN